MKNGTKVLIAVIAVILVLVLIFISSYNGLVSREENVNSYLSEIDNQLQRRSDLIPNLVATVKEYASHEEEVFTEVSEARAKLAGAGNISEVSEADGELTNALSRLIAIAESYPELKADTNFINLQDELSGTENRIANARRSYNEASKDFNTSIRKFPTNIVAKMFGFNSFDYFETTEEGRENPNVGDLFGD